jgi:hypothetical protein
VADSKLMAMDDSSPPSTGPQGYGGVERRGHDRTPPPPPRVIGRARVRPEHAGHALSLSPGTWYPLIEQPADVLTAVQEGYVGIDLAGQPRSVWAAEADAPKLDWASSSSLRKARS